MKTETTQKNLDNLHEDDYIDFIAIFEALRPGRNIIIGVTLVTTILSIIYTSNITHTPNYEATSTIEHTNYRDAANYLSFSDLNNLLIKIKESNNIESEVELSIVAYDNNFGITKKKLLVSSQSLISDQANSGLKTFIDTVQEYEDKIISSVDLKKAIVIENAIIYKETREAALTREGESFAGQEQASVEGESIVKEKETLLKEQINSLINKKKELEELLTFSSELDTIIDIKSQPYDGIQLLLAKRTIVDKINSIDNEVFNHNMELLNLDAQKIALKVNREEAGMEQARVDFKRAEQEERQAVRDLKLANQDHQVYPDSDSDLISISSISIDDISKKINKKLVIVGSFFAGFIISIIIVLGFGPLRSRNKLR